MKLRWAHILEQLKTKYKLVFLNDETFEERASFTLTRLNVFIGLSSIVVVLVGIVTLLIFFTPLREFIPGYADVKTKRNLQLMLAKTDSLEQLVNANRLFLSGVNSMLKGEDGAVGVPSKDSVQFENVELDPKIPREAAELRKMMEEEVGNLNDPSINAVALNVLTDLNFKDPVIGTLNRTMDLGNKFYGIEIKSTKNEPVHALLDGKIIAITKTNLGDYELVLQHNNNLISIYKHCNKILKNIGTLVSSGETLGYLSGTNTSALLEVQLWLNGQPINLINFLNY